MQQADEVVWSKKRWHAISGIVSAPPPTELLVPEGCSAAARLELFSRYPRRPGRVRITVPGYLGTWHLGAQGPQLTWPAWTHSVTRAKPQPWTCDIILYILLPGRPRISPISQLTSCPPPAEAPSNPSHRLQSSTEIANRWARHHVRPSPRHEPRRAFRGREATHHRELLQQEGRRWLRCAPGQALSLQSAPLRVTC